MKKLTKRNRKRDRKVVFGYHTECAPEQRFNHIATTTEWWSFKTTTCRYEPGNCCNS